MIWYFSQWLFTLEFNDSVLSSWKLNTEKRKWSLKLHQNIQNPNMWVRWWFILSYTDANTGNFSSILFFFKQCMYVILILLSWIQCRRTWGNHSPCSNLPRVQPHLPRASVCSYSASYCLCLSVLGYQLETSHHGR